MAFGVTPEGFVRKTVQDILAEIESDQLSTIADDLDVSAESIMGQVNGPIANQIGEAWENLETAYNGFDPDATEDRLLDNIAKITGTFRDGDTFSEVVLTCNLNSGTTLLSGTHYAAIATAPDILWTPKVDYTAVSSGPQPVTFRAKDSGPIEAVAGSITIIQTQVVGWNSVVNPNDADPGSRTETDAELRLRRERELATTGSATTPSIAANLSQTFEGKLQTLTVYENDTDVTDVNGLPPHSIEVLFFDGTVPAIANVDMAQAIHDAKASGCGTYGSTTANATQLQNGVTTIKPISFSRAAQLAVWLEIDLLKKSNGYVGDAEVKAHVAQQMNLLLPGEFVYPSKVIQLVQELAGVQSVSAVRLGFSASPVGTTALSVLLRQIARFDTTRILVAAT